MKFRVFRKSFKKLLLNDRKLFFAYKRIRAWTAKFEINRTAGANATLKMSNPAEMAAPRTRSYCSVVYILFNPWTRPLGTRGYVRLNADARRIANFTPKTNHRGPVV